jgi:hypothetical protein
MMITTDFETQRAEQRSSAYDLMQETNGYYDHVPLNAKDDSQAKHLGWLWHREHCGQTVVTRSDYDGQTSIVSVLGR